MFDGNFYPWYSLDLTLIINVQSISVNVKAVFAALSNCYANDDKCERNGFSKLFLIFPWTEEQKLLQVKKPGKTHAHP